MLVEVDCGWSNRTLVHSVLGRPIEGIELFEVADACFVQLLSTAHDAAQLAVAKAALLNYTCILAHLFVEGIHRLLCKVLKLEVGQEEVTRLSELAENVLPVGLV